MCIPEPYELYDRYSDKREAEMEQCPECAWCGFKIQEDHAFDTKDGLVCPYCIENAKVYLW